MGEIITFTIDTDTLDRNASLEAIERVVTPFSLDEKAIAMIKGIGIKAHRRQSPLVLLLTSRVLGGMEAGNCTLAWECENENLADERIVMAIQKPDLYL